MEDKDCNQFWTYVKPRYQIGDRLVDTGTDHFEAVVRNNSLIGALIILPGMLIPPDTVIQAGTVVGKKKNKSTIY